MDYIVTAASLTTHKGLMFVKGKKVREIQLDGEHIPALLKDGAIAEWVDPKAAAPAAPVETAPVKSEKKKDDK